jgi:hypothetical protein
MRAAFKFMPSQATAWFPCAIISSLSVPKLFVVFLMIRNWRTRVVKQQPCEEFYILVCYTVYSSRNLPTFRENVLPAFSESSNNKPDRQSTRLHGVTSQMAGLYTVHEKKNSVALVRE